MALPQLPKQFFFSFFGNGIAAIAFFLTDRAAFWAEEFQ